MEFGLEGNQIAVVVLLYIVSVVVIWKWNAGMITWEMPISFKVLLSILMVPMIWGLVVYHSGR